MTFGLFSRFILITLMLCPVFAIGEGLPEWRKFIAAPTYDTYRQLDRQLSNIQCDVSRPTNDDLNRVLNLVSSGNSAAFQALLDIRECFDGGALEDFYRASGSYLEKQPHGFVSLVIQNKISQLELHYMLVMLPLDTVDQPRLRLRLLKNRIDILSLVKIQALAEKANECRNILAEEIKSLQRIHLDG